MDTNAQPRQETTILLLGQGESDKSEVGNAILEMKSFKRSRREKLVLPAWAEIDTKTKRYELMLVDGPDLEDTNFRDKLGLAMGLCGSGVDAFVLVLKYGVPLTRDHIIAIEIVGKTLGEKWLSNNGIVLMVGGNDWHEDISFKQWCLEQNDTYGKIFSECGYRCVLCDNPKEQNLKLFEDLMALTEQIRENHGRHKNEHFEAAATMRDELIAKLQYPILYIKIQKKMSLLTSKCVKLYGLLPYTHKMKLIGAILDRAKDLLHILAKENYKTNNLGDLHARVAKLIEQAHQAEKIVEESTEAILGDFMGIKESAELVEDIRTHPALWLSLAEAAFLGIQAVGAGAAVAGLLLATNPLASVAVSAVLLKGSVGSVKQKYVPS